MSDGGLRIPRCLAEIDNGKILGFGADLAEDHPVRPLARRIVTPISQSSNLRMRTVCGFKGFSGSISPGLDPGV